MDKSIKITFLGSFQHYSAIVLNALTQSQNITVSSVVTTPPHLQGRHKVLTPNPVHALAEEKDIPVITPAELNTEALSELETFGHTDLFITAGYGKLLPNSWLEWPKLAALNLHFSLLPKFRGANPAEWALLMGDLESGVSVIEMSPEFDTGHVLAQAATLLAPEDTRETVYEKLYNLGGELLPAAIQKYVAWKGAENDDIVVDSHNPAFSFILPPVAQTTSPTPYAKRLGREDGFLSWESLQKLNTGEKIALKSVSATLLPSLNGAQEITAAFVERMSRALAGFPSLWTEIPTVKGSKKMKILSCTVLNSALVLEKVHIEGQQPAVWNQVKNQVI